MNEAPVTLLNGELAREDLPWFSVLGCGEVQYGREKIQGEFISFSPRTQVPKTSYKGQWRVPKSKGLAW